MFKIRFTTSEMEYKIGKRRNIKKEVSSQSLKNSGNPMLKGRDNYKEWYHTNIICWKREK